MPNNCEINYKIICLDDYRTRTCVVDLSQELDAVESELAQVRQFLRLSDKQKMNLLRSMQVDYQASLCDIARTMTRVHKRLSNVIDEV